MKYEKHVLAALIIVGVAAVTVVRTQAETIASTSVDEPPVKLEQIYKPALREARNQLSEKLKSYTKTEPAKAADAASTLAAYEFAEEDFNSAHEHLLLAEKLLPLALPNYKEQICKFEKHIGDCDLGRNAIASAITWYTKAAEASKDLTDVRLRVEILRALSDSLIAHKQFKTAIGVLQTLAALQEKAQDIKIGWTYVSLKDCFEQLGQPQEANREFDKAVEIFRKIIDSSAANVPPAGLQTIPCIDHDLWSSLEQEPENAPIVVWRPPNGQVPWAAVLCIHGMGLHKSAFKSFGESLANKGVIVFALDVRGFGSWRKCDRQTVNFDYCSSDVAHVSAALKKYHPETPLFLLGESMGGAIALQSGTSCSSVDAVISSVPAADRYNGTETKMKVAFRLLTRPNSPFDITKSVVEKVSRDEDVVERWKHDREARLKLGTGELIKFDTFMNKTKAQVRSLTKPVLIVQGGQDPLVRPSSTAELYDAVAANDKTLIMLGSKEHLLFESDQFSPIMLEGLVNWIRGHVNGIIK